MRKTPFARTVGIGLLLSAAALLAAPGVCPGAGASAEKATVEDVKRKMAETSEAVANYSAEQRDEAVRAVRDALAYLDARIDDVQKRIDRDWDQMSRAARENARATMDALRQRRNDAAEWYGGLQHSSAEAWDRMKKGFIGAYEVLGGAWGDAEKTFGDQKDR